MHLRLASKRIAERCLISRATRWDYGFGPGTWGRAVWSLARKPRGIALLVSAAAIVAAIGCRAATSSPNVTVEHEISPQPARVGMNTVVVKLTNSSGNPVVSARIMLEADMSHAGMSPVFGEAKEVQPGQYQSQLMLGMAGDWVILVHGSLASGEKLERQFDVRGVRPN